MLQQTNHSLLGAAVFVEVKRPFISHIHLPRSIFATLSHNLLFLLSLSHVLLQT